MNVLEQLQNNYIMHKSAKLAFRKIEMCINSTVDGGTPRSVLILGDAGAGKTAMLEVTKTHIIKNHPHEDINCDTFLFVEAPSPSSLKALQSAFYEEMGASKLDNQRHTEARRTKQIIELINKHGYKVIANDEVHHFTEKYKANHESVVCDFYKTVMRETGCAFILVGKPVAEKLVRSDDQLRRRFLGTSRLERFAPPHKGNREFQAFVNMYREACPVDHVDFSDDFLTRLYIACDGLPGLWHTLIELAIRTNPAKKLIDMNDIESAFEKEFQPSDVLGFNPFEASLLDVEHWLKTSFEA
ncbi:TniB family NTP-binding protein [Photobacterium sp. BZF1]|uniref:TniB family NTP-binding protein n=1 Tax=Photobacterium sp. BZF1 TaxID=1904457 RepID=UPI0016537274|nr:TniB family NTP-binding protein [Photobacterium sp. BZF1]MBC7006619.1 TniB family NTP-binding protein [Photobacterium sp. BZF1]